MVTRFALRLILPSAIAYVGIVVAAILIDLPLHASGYMWVGRYLGVVGTVLLLLSFLYSLR